MADSALQRKNMVESQVRPSDVTDRRITAAMQDIARETFVPSKAERALAYMDGAVPVGGGRAMMAPRTLARLMQLADLEPTSKVLIVGALTGYSAAIASRMAAKVVALEVDASLASAARENLASIGAANVEVVGGGLAAGYADGAPYDAIIVDGAVEDLPEALFAQLAQGGRLVAIKARQGLGRAVVATKVAHTPSERVAFDASAPLVPGFERPASFIF
ncbi:MAG: protein-L-isoaspartate O-methyltransferase [Hyphomicrobium sp.]